MPRKDKEARLAYQREWYARPENRDRVKAKTRERKYVTYAGVCKNCGGPTIGWRGPNRAPDYCGKPACRKALWEMKKSVIASIQKITKGKTLTLEEAATQSERHRRTTPPASHT